MFAFHAAEQRQRDSMKFQFGDVIENAAASSDNPTGRGFFVREFTRTGRMNPGTFVELTDGKGKFWTHAKNSGNLSLITKSEMKCE